ncbi:cupin domain-containing protein [Oscillibacter sp.]|uniref:cupin domain-containing protein n=1 Tax=Oscillibacter sp. TaxID=1945593 RepID=UPI002D7ED8AA|nr:cupin domain-containing protein [Oscillibacter sp.]
MEQPNVFDQFDAAGRLCLPGAETAFGDLPWNPHPDFEGVELKHLVTSRETVGQFSFHLVRVAPGKAIGTHVHQTQLETHEVVAGRGVCVSGGTRLVYEPGVVSILPKGEPHGVEAGPEGLRLFAKFIPALV